MLCLYPIQMGKVFKTTCIGNFHSIFVIGVGFYLRKPFTDASKAVDIFLFCRRCMFVPECCKGMCMGECYNNLLFTVERNRITGNRLLVYKNRRHFWYFGLIPNYLYIFNLKCSIRRIYSDIRKFANINSHSYTILHISSANFHGVRKFGDLLICAFKRFVRAIYNGCFRSSLLFILGYFYRFCNPI